MARNDAYGYAFETCLCCGAATLLVLVAPAAAAARPAPISGKLSKPGYTVIALADNGTASSVRQEAQLQAPPPGRR